MAALHLVAQVCKIGKNIGVRSEVVFCESNPIWYQRSSRSGAGEAKQTRDKQSPVHR